MKKLRFDILLKPKLPIILSMSYFYRPYLQIFVRSQILNSYRNDSYQI